MGGLTKMDERRMIAEGLGAVATTAFEMKKNDVEARSQLLAAMEAVGVAGDADVLDEAAASIAGGPQYPVGHPMAAEILNTQLAGRELLQRVAAELRAQAGPPATAE